MISDMHCVLVETSLDTRLLVLINNDENVSVFKEKLRKEHVECFPGFGEITISAVKVEWSGRRFSHLPDSMIVSKVFECNSNKDWIISVDASAVRADKTEMAACSNPNDDLLEKKTEITLMTRKDIVSSEKDGIDNGENQQTFSNPDELLEKKTEITNDHTLERESLNTQVAEEKKSKKKKKKKKCSDVKKSNRRKSPDESPKLCGELQVDVASESCAIGKDIVSSERDDIDIEENQQKNSNPDELLEKKAEIASDTIPEEALKTEAAEEKTKKRKRKILDSKKSSRKKKSNESHKLCGKVETPEAVQMKTDDVEVASISGKNSTQKRNHPQAEHVSAEEKKNLESLCLSDSPSFKVSVTVSNLRDNRLYLPRKISKSSILNEKMDEIILMDKQGRKWMLSLSCKKSSGELYITRGWRSFCEENGQKAGCSFVFKLVSNRTTPLLIMTSEDSTSEQLVEKKHSQEEEV